MEKSELERLREENELLRTESEELKKLIRQMAAGLKGIVTDFMPHVDAATRAHLTDAVSGFDRMLVILELDAAKDDRGAIN